MENKLIIPKFREDICCDIIGKDENRNILLYDIEGYGEQSIQLPYQFLTLIQLMDGKSDIDEFIIKVRELGHLNIDLDFTVNLLKKFDELCFLETPRYFWVKYLLDIYKKSPDKPPVCAGISYPVNPEECRLFLDELMYNSIVNNSILNINKIKAIIAPHIDFNIGIEAHKAYASAYSSIENTDADLFVIFGTSHYVSSDYFMLTRKNYVTPFGIIETDSELLNKIDSLLPFQATYDDIAHKNEHSIEFQALLLKHLFSERNIKILPILVGSLHDFIYKNKLPTSDSRFNLFIETLRESIDLLGRKAIFIAGADLAHVGRKFGDDFDAETIFTQLRFEDMQLLDSLLRTNEDAFFSLVSSVKDCRRICGLSPIYALMKSVNPSKGLLLHYDIWDEQETKSAVSFAGMAFEN